MGGDRRLAIRINRPLHDRRSTLLVESAEDPIPMVASAEFGVDKQMSESNNAVFLSYTSEDADAARQICESFREAGVEVWLDQSELRGGDAWDAAIRKQIKTCTLFMPVISANASARAEGYFRLEWKLAVDRSHLIAAERAFIVPVVIDETGDSDALVPDKFREVQWTRCPAGQVPAKFVERVVHLLSLDDHKVPTANVHARGTIPPLVATRPRTSRRLGMIGAVTVAVLVVVGAVVAYKTAFHSAAIGVVAVLPFENATGDPANEYLSNGISESLINKLSGLSGLHVISRTSAFAFKGKKLDPTEIGKKLGVDALILGSLSQHGSSLNVTAELVSVRDATQLWGEKYARPVDDVLQIEGDIAATIAQTLRRRLSGDEKVKLTREDTSDPEAYRLYLKGRDFLVGTDQEMDKSIDYFQRAVARAPNYAMAHAGLADAYTVQAFLRASGRAEAAGKARAAVTRALELDPDLGEAHAALASILYLFEWDWAGADAEFRRGISLSPGSEAVHEAYGSFLISMGRLDEGLAQSREAARLDPLSVQPFHDIAINALVRGDYGQAAAGFRRTIDIDPDWTWGYIKLGRTLSLQKKCKEAFVQTEIAERRIAGGASPFSRSWLGSTYANCGDIARARQKLAEMHAIEAKRYVDPATFAGVHASLGEMDEALRWYQKAFEDRSPDMVYAMVASRITPQLADNVGYQAIIGRMAFPQPAK
jgi:TolB-like protein/Tfp pilus assembly protein PilF